MQEVIIRVSEKSPVIAALQTAVKVRGLIDQFQKLVADSGLTEEEINNFMLTVTSAEERGHVHFPEVWKEYVRKASFEEARYRARIIRAVLALKNSE